MQDYHLVKSASHKTIFMSLSIDYPYQYKYIYEYYCKKYGKQKACNILADKSVKFLSRANDICKWKDSFDKGIFYEIKKLDDSTIHSKQRPKTKLADQSHTRLGSGFSMGLSWGITFSVIFTIAWFIICSIFNIHYDFQFIPYIVPYLIGATLLICAILEIYNFIARKRFNKLQKEFPYASLYIQHCAQNVEVKEIVNIPKTELELLNIYYEAISSALQKQINLHKELLFNKLNEFCQSANYHNVVSKSSHSYYYGRRLLSNKKLMPFSEIREHFDEPKGFDVLMALLNINSCVSSPACKYSDGYFDTAFFKTNPQNNYRANEASIITTAAIVAVVVSFFCFKFPFVWHQQKPIAQELFLQDSLAKYNQACALIDLNYSKKLQQPVYLVGVSVKHHMLRNGGIGNDWYEYAEVNGEEINYSEVTVPVVVGDTLKLYSEIVEEDPSSDDIGSNNENIPVTAEQIESGFNTTLTTNVYEHHGHGAGESATWESKFQIRKIKQLKNPPENYKPKKEPYPPKPSEKTKFDISSWDVFKLTMKNLL